jgi:hypothetical protein
MLIDLNISTLCGAIIVSWPTMFYIGSFQILSVVYELRVSKDKVMDGKKKVVDNW